MYTILEKLKRSFIHVYETLLNKTPDWQCYSPRGIGELGVLAGSVRVVYNGICLICSRKQHEKGLYQEMEETRDYRYFEEDTHFFYNGNCLHCKEAWREQQALLVKALLG